MYSLISTFQRVPMSSTRRIESTTVLIEELTAMSVSKVNKSTLIRSSAVPSLLYRRCLYTCGLISMISINNTTKSCSIYLSANFLHLS